MCGPSIASVWCSMWFVVSEKCVWVCNWSSRVYALSGFFAHVCRIHVDAAVILWFRKITDELVERPRLLCFICSGDRFFCLCR